MPIVFTSVTDPVGGGLVASLARPGGNTTGFTLSEYGLSGKWLEFLKEIAPRVMRAAVLRDPVAVGIGQFAAIQAVAPSVQVELSPVDVRDTGEMERAVTAFAHRPNGGLIATASAFTTIHRELIIALAAQHQLPAVYPDAARQRRRGDRVSVKLLQCIEPLLAQSGVSLRRECLVAIGGEADIAPTPPAGRCEAIDPKRT